MSIRHGYVSLMAFLYLEFFSALLVWRYSNEMLFSWHLLLVHTLYLVRWLYIPLDILKKFLFL